MGAIIYILANVYFEDMSLIGIMAGFFEPIGRFMGLDGAVILAFLLGSVANETVIPLMLMIYSAEGAIGSEMGVSAMADFLRMNGWSAVTALSAMLFSLFHWPCTTSLITVYKETKSRKMTLLAFLLPSVIGVLFCATVGFFG
jgi:ferrous iron transport protein B